MFLHKETLILLQTIKNLWRSLIFSKTRGRCFCITSHKRAILHHLFPHFAMILITPHHKWFFNFVMQYKTRIFFQINLKRIETWNHTLFYEVFLTYNYFMLWSFWIKWHHKNYSCTFFQKRLVKLKMFFVKLYRAQHDFKGERNLNKFPCNDLNSTKKTFKTKSVLLFLSPLR